MFSYSFFSNGGAVFHGATIVEYPGRKFSLWVDDAGRLLAATGSRWDRSDCACRSVVPNSRQWRACQSRAAGLYRIHVGPEYTHLGA